MHKIFLTLSLAALSTSALADNQLTDTFLQPSKISSEATGWAFSTKLGINEGSSEIINDGYRLEIPRFTWQKNANDQILFKASVPYVYQNNDTKTTFTIGDPTFLTTIQASEQSTFTVGVTEPAANRYIEPDVVRFLGYYTHSLPTDFTLLTFQFGVEITDRFAQEGQDDLLSFGISSEFASPNIGLHLIHKQVVDGKWWDITQPLDTPLNRTNITASYTLAPIATKHQFKLYTGVQKADDWQYIFGVQVSSK